MPPLTYQPGRASWVLPVLAGLSLSFGLSQRAAGQVVRYQNGPGRPRYTAAQLDSLLQARNAKLAGQGLLVERQLGPAAQHHDTLVQAYSLRISDAAVRANEQRYLALVGRPLPAFALRDLAGRRVTAAGLRGHPAVLNLWFTSCPPCLAEIPALNQFRAQHPGVRFLALTYEPATQVRTFLRARPFTWQHLPAAGAYCARFTRDYPLSVFVDRRGIIRQIIGGLPQPYDHATHQAVATVDPTAFAQALRAIL